MDVPEGVRGVDQVTRRLVSDADVTPGLPGAHGGSPVVWHSLVTVTVTAMVADLDGVWVAVAVIIHHPLQVIWLGLVVQSACRW